MAKGIFPPLDKAIFTQVDKLKTSSFYQQVGDLTNSLSDFQQKIVNQVFTFILILIPFSLVIAFFISNRNFKKQIETKQEIVALVEQYDQRQGQVGNLSNIVLANNPITGKTTLEGKIKSILGRHGAAAGKAKVTKFEQTSPSSTISLSEAKIEFNGFTMKHMSGFLQDLIYQERMKVAEIKVQRNSKTELLAGSLQVSHYGKLAVQSDKNEN